MHALPAKVQLKMATSGQSHAGPGAGVLEGPASGSKKHCAASQQSRIMQSRSIYHVHRPMVTHPQVPALAQIQRSQ